MSKSHAADFIRDFFILIFPFILVSWATLTQKSISLPLGIPVPASLFLASFGLFLFLWSLWILTKKGKGLPMNAFPPTQFVKQGPYRFFSHPIYLGFCLLIYGGSAFLGSSSGWYLVAPVLTLGCVALVMGYENPNRVLRFSTLKYQPFVGLIDRDKQKPDTSDKLKIGLYLVFFFLFCAAINLSWSPVFPGTIASLVFLIYIYVISILIREKKNFELLTKLTIQLLVFLTLTTFYAAILQ